MIKSLFMLMFKNPLFVMSLSGTAVFIVYLLTYLLLKWYFSLKWRYRILKIAMLFYLFPFPLCKYALWGFFYDHVLFIQEMAGQCKHSEKSMDYIVVINRDSIRLSSKVQSIYITVLLIVLISLFIFLRQAFQYRKMKQMHFSELGEAAEEKMQEIFSKKKELLHIKRKIRFICSEYCESPITIGVRAPIVLFPIQNKNNILDDELCEYMITHELVHIKHHDVLFKLTGLLVSAIHWFNPFVHLLVNELSCISEMYCDSVVMEGKGEKERYKYGNLMLMLISETPFLNKEKFGTGFAAFRKKTIYKRRILEMKRSKKDKTFLSVIAAMVICMVGGATAFAYQPPDTITNEGDKAIGTDLAILEESILPEKLVADCFAVSDAGVVYNLCNDDENARKICLHDYSISVKVTNHEKDDKGGCIVEVYSALKCKKCADIKWGDLLSSHTYVTCPH